MPQNEVLSKYFLGGCMDMSSPALSKKYLQILINVYVIVCGNGIIVFVWCYFVYALIYFAFFIFLSLLPVFKCKIGTDTFVFSI